MLKRGSSSKSLSTSKALAKLRLEASVKIACIYLIVGLLWIFYSDLLLGMLLGQRVDLILQVGTFKGWVYVIVTAVMLYGLIDREIQLSRRAMGQLKTTLSELLETRAALQANQERLNLAIAGTNDGIWDWDLHTDAVFYSPAWMKILGYDDEPLAPVLETWWGRMHPADREAAQVAVQAHLDGHTTVYQDMHRLRHADGQWRWVEVKGRCVMRDEGDRPYRLTGTLADVTDRKRVEQALQDSESRYRQVVQTQTDLILRSHPDTTITFANETLCLVLGRSLADVIGFQWIEFAHPDDIGRILQSIADLTPQKPSFLTENHDRRANGQMGWTQWINQGVFDDQGHLLEIQSVGRDITQLKQTEAALRESEERFRVFMNHSPAATWIVSAEGEMEYVNSTYTQMFQVPEQVVGKHLSELYPPELAQTFLANIQKAIQTGQVIQVIEPATRPDGSIGEFLAYKFLLPHADGRQAVGGVALDITEQQALIREQQQAEETLRKQFNLLSLAQQAAQMGVYEWDVVADQAYWTAEMELLMGMKLEARSHNLEPWLAQLHPEDQLAFQQRVEQWLQSPNLQPEPIEYRFIRQGEERWIDARGYIVRDAQGQPLKMIGTNLDITERKRAEAELHQREQEFRALVENAPDIIVRFDRNLRHLYINPAIEALTGLSPQPFIGKSNRELGMPEDQVTSWDAHLTQVFTSGQQKNFEFEFDAPAGVRQYESRCVPEFDRDGRVVSVLSIARDTTEQKQLEHALRQQIERVELMRAIAQRIRQSLKLDDILTTTVLEVKQLLQADRVVVYQFNPDMGGTIVAEAVTPDWTASLGITLDDTYFTPGSGVAYRQGQTQAIANIQTAGLTDAYRRTLEQFEVKAHLIVPILLMGEGGSAGIERSPQALLWGLLIAHQCATSREWKPTNIELLEQIAVQLAIAIRQAQAFEQAQTELRERQQAEAQLRAALAEKEVLLKEIHHRVKNNLQIVSGLLQLQALGVSDDQTISVLRESQNRIESMSLIHKKLYTSSDLGQIDVADYIHSLATSLLTTYQISPGTVALMVDVAPVLLSLDQAIPCGLMINELVSNALKYAFSNNQPGEIHIQLHQLGQELILTIRDNGIGLPEFIDFQSTQSLGLSLVHALATEQLEGSLTVDCSHGTQFTIRFPQLP